MSFLRVLVSGLLLVSATAHAEQSAEFVRLWKAYETDTNQISLQENCKPKWVHAEMNVRFRGTIILHHGFTACTQQYYLWAGDLAHAGYDVLLPVLPGHGHVLKTDKKGKLYNDTDSLPTRKNWASVYAKAVGTFNRIMAQSAGDRVVGGLSVGGEVAVGSVLADVKLYKRLILFAPFFRLSTEQAPLSENDGKWLQEIQKYLGPILNKDKPMAIDLAANPGGYLYSFSNRRQSWGKGCEINERNVGRAGYCNWTLNAVSADQAYGLNLIAKASTMTEFPQTQILAVEKDPTAATPFISKFFEIIKPRSSYNASMCLFRKDTNHSLISTYDSPEQAKYWHTFLREQSTRFVVDGVWVRQSAELLADEGSTPACDISNPAQYNPFDWMHR